MTEHDIIVFGAAPAMTLAVLAVAIWTGLK